MRSTGIRMLFVAAIAAGCDGRPLTNGSFTRGGAANPETATGADGHAGAAGDSEGESGGAGAGGSPGAAGNPGAGPAVAGSGGANSAASGIGGTNNNGGADQLCGDLTAGGLVIGTMTQPGPPPDLGEGGTLVDGIYDLVSMTQYDTEGPVDITDQVTIRISGGGTNIEYVSGAYRFDLAIDVAPSGGRLNDTQVCPSGCPICNMFVGPGYTATPGTLYSIRLGFAKTFRLRPPQGGP